MENIINEVALKLGVKDKQVKNTLDLLSEGNTVPFIARYRKELTNNLDEEQIAFIEKEYKYLENLKKRKEDVLRLIETRGKLTEEIKEAIAKATKLNEVEDIYRPYKENKKTRATDAIAKGLEPLADYILKLPRNINIEDIAYKYLNDNVKDIKEAIDGAKDIIAERVSDNIKIRERIKNSLANYGFILTKEKKKHDDEKKVYKLYYDHKEKLKYIEAHRVMAINRASKEKVITISFDYDKEYIINYAFRGLTHDLKSSVNELIYDACKDGLERLAFPSIENEVWKEKVEEASLKSIDVFAMNVEKLLLVSPMNSKKILGFDPAFRTGCKLAVLDTSGKMLKIEKIYPHAPINKTKEASAILAKLCKDYDIDIIAIGNGTASRESESFVAKTISDYKLDCKYTIVSEAGASVYSASELARSEFPDLQVEERSAISIGRRVIDPLSELIKIDPKSIGVGQYQHDLPAKELDSKLDFIIEKTVNRVGVDLNTASKELLEHISGLNKTIANNIVEYRNDNGEFKSRTELKKVPKLGPKAFEQASGFLRIKDAKEELDMTAIHPESYKIAKEIIKMCGNMKLNTEELKEAVEALDIKELSEKLNSDEYTIKDIIDALKAPLRDYREEYDGPILRQDILQISDLKIGDKLSGVVRNVVDFGAFVDVGLHDDGLVHKSKMIKGNRNPIVSDILHVGDIIDVYVIDIDVEREKIALSLLEV